MAKESVSWNVVRFSRARVLFAAAFAVLVNSNLAEAQHADLMCEKEFQIGDVAEGGVLDDGVIPPGETMLVPVSVRVIGRDSGLPSKEDMLVSMQGTTNKSLTRRANTDIYEGTLKPDRYTLEVRSSAGDLSAPRRYITVKSALKSKLKEIPAFVAKRPVPYLRLGRGLLPFTPRYDMIVVVFPFNVPDESFPQKLANAVKGAKLAVKPLNKENPYGLSFIEANGALLIFSVTDLDKREAAVTGLFDLLETFKQPGRIGIPFDLRYASFKVLDEYFSVRLKGKSDSAAISSWNTANLEEFKRELPKSSGLWQVRFKAKNYCQNLATLEIEFSKKPEERQLVVGEADILYRLNYTANVDPSWPADPEYDIYQMVSPRGAHRRQNIRKAWELVALIRSKNNEVASEAVVVGTLDSGIDKKVRELADCKANDGQPQISACYDFEAGLNCDDRGYDAPGDGLEAHGMAVFAVIASCANNSRELTGIAPGTYHVAVRKPTYTSNFDYANALLWMAGFNVTCPPGAYCIQPAPLQKPAQIINASHGFKQPYSSDPLNPMPITLPDTLDTAFEQLVTNGRGMLGTVLVYSAGNVGVEVLDTTEPMAADAEAAAAGRKRTITAANCFYNDALGEERRYGDYITNCSDCSNYGSAIDLCAIGKGAQTISKWCANREQDPCEFGGTSASAPTVSGVVALMLSANEKLKWNEIRDILRMTARKVDSAGGSWVNNRSIWYGSGVVNACEAVREALSRRPSPPSVQSNFCPVF